MLIHYGSYLTKRLFLRSKKNKILDTLKYLAHRLFYEKKCHNHRYCWINIRGNKTQFCMQQSSLYRKCYSNSHTAYYVKLPHIQLRFDSCRLIFLTVMTEYRIHNRTTYTYKKFEYRYAPRIYLMSTMKQQLYILNHEITCECK